MLSFRSLFLLAGFCCLETLFAGEPNALEAYVSRPDPAFNWKKTEQKKSGTALAIRLELVSQHWRNQFWSHHLLLVRPAKVRNPKIGFLFITGDGDGGSSLEMLKTLADRAGAIAAVITKIPNQPLYDGKKEDALIAFTFDQFLKTEDPTWPLLFPMVKSAVRGMDTIQAFAEKELGQKIEHFVVSGASKRGWTTWLTAAVDPRVKAMAPMVIDMLNMREQLLWTEKMYGEQSEQIHDYTELNLHQKQDLPQMVLLRGWVDPYAYRNRYTMPKLLLLGTNDPYWVVDSLRHYWDDLPEPKLLFQTPNAGHDLAGGKDAIPVLAAFFQMIADGEPLPKFEWKFNPKNNDSQLEWKTKEKPDAARVWTASSKDRDFRDDKWSNRSVELKEGAAMEIPLSAPEQGFQATLGEVELKTARGNRYKLSTGARVLPDNIGKR